MLLELLLGGVQDGFEAGVYVATKAVGVFPFRALGCRASGSGSKRPRSMRKAMPPNPEMKALNLPKAQTRKPEVLNPKSPQHNPLKNPQLLTLKLLLNAPKND